MRRFYFSFIAVFICTNIFAQIYVPNGVGGILNSTVAGRVGVGTSNPEGNFEIYGQTHPEFILSSPDSKLRFGIATTDCGYATFSKKGDIVLRTSGGLDSRKGIIFNINNDLGDGRSYFKFGDAKNGGWFSIYNNKQVVINGMVGIGKSNPTMALEVNGTIRSKEIQVEIANWPDYVFSPEYDLPSLDEVYLYIKEKQHLPGIPSAAESEKEGVNLGEMNTILLKKIEELTLYIISQEKRIRHLEEKHNGE